MCELQDGVFTRDQAIAAGLTRNQIQWNLQTGRWDQMFPCVYRIHGGAAKPIHRLRGALLWAGEGSIASHLSAAYLWNIVDRFPPIEVTARVKHKPISDIALHHRKIADSESKIIDGLAVTTPVRTLLDLASRDRWLTEIALDAFLRNKLVTLEEVTRFIDAVGGRGVRGTKPLRELLALRQPGDLVESALERRLVNAMRRWGLPEPVSQHQVILGGRIFRIDFAYPDLLVGIEADGYKYHSGRERFDRDTSRRNQLAASGWLMIHVTWARLKDSPSQVRREIEMALDSRRSFRDRRAYDSVNLRKERG